MTAVVRRRSELTTKATVDREWPYQVALHQDACTGHHYWTLRRYCSDEGLSLCTRGHSFKTTAGWHQVFCFAKLRDAERFRTRFGGEIIDAKDRPL